MKNFMKVCLIAGGVCILIGGGITTVAAAMGGRLSDLPSWNYRWLGRDIVGDITGDLRSEWMILAVTYRISLTTALMNWTGNLMRLAAAMTG